MPFVMFQSRYRAASHFRKLNRIETQARGFFRFNLVIERLLISGVPAELLIRFG